MKVSVLALLKLHIDKALRKDKADVFIDAIFISKYGNCSLYHCMFKYVLFFSPDETLEQGRNCSDSSLALYIIIINCIHE